MPDVSALGIKITSTGVVKTTGELDKFAIAAKAAAQAASRPISVKVSSSTAKALADIRAMEKALSSIRAATRGNIGVRVTSAGSARIISDIAKMGTALRDARAAARSPINVRVSATGVSETVAQLQRLIAQLERARREAGRGAGSGGGGGAPTRGDIGATVSMAGAVRGLAGAFTALSLINLAEKYADLTDQSKLLTAQLRLATSETGNFAKAQEDVRRIAAGTRSELGSTAALYGKLMLNSRQLGITQLEAARATETVAKAFKVSGASTAEASQGTRQLVQALQSGVLRGDEFITMTEAAPRLLKLLADSLGVTQGKLREMAEEGELTSAKLTQAFTDKKFTEGLDKEFAQLPVTFGDAMQQIENAAIITFGAFDEGGQFSKSIVGFAVGGAQGFADMERAATQMGSNLRGIIDGLVAAFKPFVEDLERINWLLGSEIPASSDMGLGRTLADFDKLTAWYARNQWWLNPLGPKASPSNLSKPYEDARRKNSGATLAREVGDITLNNFQRQRERDQQQEASINRVAAATKKATKAKKEHASAAENLAKRLENERKATETLIEGLYDAAAGYYESAKAGKAAEIQAEAVAKGMKKGSGDATAYATQQLRKYVAEQVASGAESVRTMLDQTENQKKVNDQVALGQIRAEDAAQALSDLNEQRALTIALDIAKTFKDEGAAAAAAQAALDAMRAAQKKANDEAQRTIDLGQEKQILIGVGDIDRETEELRKLGEARINAMKGLSGDALADKLRRLAQAYELTALSAEYDRKIADANAASHFKAAAAYAAEYEARKKQLIQGQGQGNAEDDMARNRDYAIKAAHDIADIIGGEIGQAANALIDAVNEIDAALSGIGNELGAAFASFSKGARLGGAFGALSGSGTGGALGGGMGQVIAEKAFGKLGAFAGPLGAIAGGIIGGIIGGLFKKTPKASATISIIAGEAMDVAIAGNKSKLKAAAGQMANSIISGLTDLAAALGAELTGDAKVSIGIRNGNYRVDPTGAGRTKGAGVIDFGEDQAAAIAFALQDAIKDGVLKGLGDSLNRLIQGDGDLQAQLEKALSFKSVFDDLLKMQDPQAFDLQGLDQWRAGMDKIFAEAGATSDELAKLEELTGLKRAEIVDKYAQEALEKERTRRELEIQIMQLEGKDAEALAASRALELSKMEESLRPLQERIYVLEDEATAAEKAKAIADERAGLEQTLLQLQGSTATLRAQERDALDPLNRDLYDLIAAMQDWQEAVQKSQELFAAQSSVEQEILKLQGQIGNDPALTARALQLAREAELRAADATLRPLLLRKYALEDEVTAMEAANKAAEDAAAAQKAIMDERYGLETQWLELIGDKATLRARELEKLDPSNRQLQQNIWELQDAQEAAAKAAEAAAQAQQDYADALASARDVLSQAYERESSALQQTIDKFRGFADTIAEFRRGLFASDNPAVAFGAAQDQFLKTSRNAAFGNEPSLQAFVGDAQAYLDAAKNNAGSLLEYQRIVAQVAVASRRAESGANGVANEAQRQLDLMTEQVKGILDLNENIVSFGDALAAYTEVQAQGIPVISDIIAAGLSEVTATLLDTADKSEEKSDVVASLLAQVLDRLNRLDQNLNNVTKGGNYLSVGSDPDTDTPVRVLDITP